MASRSGSALSPSPATRPLTVTSPCSISSSALRREATPARARIFWMRSSLMAFPSPGEASRRLRLPLLQLRHLAQEGLLAVLAGDGLLAASRVDPRHLGEPGHLAGVAGAEALLELLERRQVLQAVEAEVDQELPRGAVEEGLAHHLLAAHDAYHPPLEQGLEHPGRANAAQLLDLGAGDRLAVGDEGGGLQRRHREFVPPRDVEEAAQPAYHLRAGRQAHAAGHVLHHHAPPLLPREAGEHRLQRLGRLLALLLVEQLQELGPRHRLGGDEEDRLQSRLHFTPLGHTPIASRSTSPSSRVVR